MWQPKKRKGERKKEKVGGKREEWREEKVEGDRKRRGAEEKN